MSVLSKFDESYSTNTTAIEPPRILLKIDEKVAIIAAGFTGTLAVTAIAAYITTLVKNQSDSHSCDVISGDVDKTRYEYSASGRHCDTTSESKTIKAAVQKALEYMEDHNVSQACFELKHGGTWKGLLQLAVANRNIIHNKCRTVTYKIDV